MSRATQAVKLISLPLKEAQRLKWIAGRKKYGPVFVGHPLEQLYDEMIDALNYVEEADRQGLVHPMWAKGVSERLEAIAEDVVRQWRAGANHS